MAPIHSGCGPRNLTTNPRAQGASRAFVVISPPRDVLLSRREPRLAAVTSFPRTGRQGVSALSPPRLRDEKTRPRFRRRFRPGTTRKPRTSKPLPCSPLAESRLRSREERARSYLRDTPSLRRLNHEADFAAVAPPTPRTGYRPAAADLPRLAIVFPQLVTSLEEVTLRASNRMSQAPARA